MADVLKILRSTTAANRPAGRAFGEIFWNDADGVFGVIDSAGNPVDLTGAEPPADNQNYTRQTPSAGGPSVWTLGGGSVRVVTAPPAAGSGAPNDLWVVVP